MIPALGTGRVLLSLVCLPSVNIQVIVSQREQPHNAGHLILMRDSDRRMEPGASALVLGVGGDTLTCVAAILDNHKLHRPMSLDLLWQVHCNPVFLLIPCACLACRRETLLRQCWSP